MVKCKTGCNKSCRSCCKDSKTFGFVFFRFFYDFLGIFKVRCFEFMAFLHLAPWTFGFFSGETPGRKTEEGRRRHFQRIGSPAVGDSQGKRKRGARATFGGARGSQTWAVVASPRRGAAGGGLVRGGGVPGGERRRWPGVGGSRRRGGAI